jgi:tRNA/tmRNA/rRNA uracil-C5-methylase (TrmA/RlmC/RlmD family)
MAAPGARLVLTIEKPAAGGRMIARHDGRVVLVSGAIPGERVVAQIERVGQGVVYATTIAIEDASGDRRESLADPLCGGCLYAHIAYPRQLEIKAQVIDDAFGRIARAPLAVRVTVAPSPDEGYRMRARLHVRDGRAGFFREGTHDLCDVRATRQLLPATCDVVDLIAANLRSRAVDVGAIELSENVDASERVVHLELAGPSADPASGALAAVGRSPGLTGLTSACRQGPPGARISGPRAVRPALVAGEPYVSDVLSIGDKRLALRRHVLAFFQGNRFLVGALAAHVTGHVGPGSDVVDLYAGTGLFALGAAARGARVTAVEGDDLAAADLAVNGRAAGGLIDAVHRSVETYLSHARGRPDTVIVDPPRTGLSREALEGAVRLGARTIVYVSCDVATLARDARRLLDAGYAIAAADAFDLFPNTPHVETVVRFEDAGSPRPKVSDA